MLSPHFEEELSEALAGADVSGASMEAAIGILRQLDDDMMELPAGIRGARKGLKRDRASGEPISFAAINLIPGSHKGKCRDLLMVISLGKKEFTERLRQAIDHCIQCLNATRGIIFVSDYWDNEAFNQERKSTFETLNKQLGVQLVGVLLAGNTWVVVPIVP